MKDRKSRFLSLLMCLTVAMTLCIGSIAPVFASDEASGSDAVVESVDFAADSLTAAMADAVIINSGDTIKADNSTTYILPKLSTGQATFKIVAPAKGYFTLSLCGYSYYQSSGTEYTYGTDFKTTGFKDFEWVSTDNVNRFVGVKKGTYTFTVKPIGDYALIKAKFTKVSEGKFGKKKGKAPSLKKGSTRKALMVTNAKQTHWYKFKNPKTQKISVIVDGRLSGGSSAGLKVTMYDKRRSMGYSTIKSPGGKLTIKPYTLGKGQKLVKGTYWIKVQSYKAGNGYFTVKWKKR